MPSAANERSGGLPETRRLPIIAHETPRLEPATRRKIAAHAQHLRRNDLGLDDVAPFGPGVAAGLGDRPSLVIEDHSAITLFEAVGDISYSYRACMLAGDGDLVALGIARSPAFEAYCRDQLGLGACQVLSPAKIQGARTLSLACAEDPEVVERAAGLARRTGGLNVLPYMATGGAWLLASRIAEAAGAPVRVAGPPPRLVHRVNDKVWFAASVKALLGASAQPPSHAAHGLAALARQARAMADRGATVAVKLPSSASSAGNLVLEPSLLRQRGHAALSRQIHAALRLKGWRGDFPLQVTAWEAPVIASPSVQLWVPLREQGGIVVEGIFDQLLTGPDTLFCGAVPTRLGRPLCQRLANEAAALAGLFQRLGYFGRCSLDSIVVGRGEADAEVHWVECNGRWGGTSIPMTLANRLIGDWSSAYCLIAERGGLGFTPRPFARFLVEFADQLCRHGARPRGAVVLSPNRIEAGSGFELLILGDDEGDAQARSRAFAERLGVPPAGIQLSRP